MPIAQHGALVIDEPPRQLAVRINDDVVQAKVPVHQHRMILWEGRSLLKRDVDPFKQLFVLDDQGQMGKVLRPRPI